MAVFNAIKTMQIALSTTPSAAIILPIPAGSTDLKGMYFRAWTDTGVGFLKFGGSSVASDKTVTSNALADGNIPTNAYNDEPQLIPSGGTYLSAVALSGTPNLFVEIGTLTGE